MVIESLNSQDKVKALLKSYFDESQSRSPGFSLRAYARKLKISPSTLSEILNDKRRVSRKLAIRICDNLLLDPALVDNVLSSFDDDESDIENKINVNVDESFSNLNMDQFHLVGEWYYFAILSLADTDDFIGTVEAVSQRLGLSKLISKTALARLERLNLLTRSSVGKYSATGKQFSTTTDIANSSLKKHHYQNLELARTSLDNDEIEERDFSFISMAVDPKDIPIIKKRIKDFRRNLCQEFEKGKRKEVFKMCIQLFKLTK